MPELPEVEIYRRYLQEALQGRSVQRLTRDNEGRMVPDGWEALNEAVVGRQFAGTERIGKYLFTCWEGDRWLLWHFGMTGKPVYFREEAERPKYSRIEFHLDDGGILAFDSLRKFSRLHLVASPRTYQQENKLGDDALQVSLESFQAFLNKRKAPIKSALLLQQGFAGVGNWIADEMLFQAGILPDRPAQALSREQLVELHRRMQAIMQEAIDSGAAYRQFPPGYMVGHRWGDGQCPHGHGELQVMKLGGRSTYYCTECQR